MGNMVRAAVTIRGTRPLWWHKFGPDALPLEKQEREGVAGNDPSEWRRTVLVSREGQLFLDPTYAFGAIRDAARFTKKGRGSIQTAVVATLQCEDDRILIDRWMPGFPNGTACDLATIGTPTGDPEELVYLDVRGVRNPSTKGRNVRYRVAASAGWTCALHITWDKTVVSRGEMEAVLTDAGRLVGLGNGRSIGMGRFVVTAFDVTDGD